MLNDDDQLTRYGNAFYQFNAAGQRTQKEVGASVTRYTYGVLGELQRVELPDGRVVMYQYDALKRRIGRQVDGSTTARWLWGGAPGPVAEVDANGNTLTTFVYGTGISSPDYMVRGAETFALIRDHLGSVRFVLNTADNAIAQELRYDPFGKVILDTNPGFQPFGYAGGLYDPDTELTRFGARDYDAHTARWTARDPIAFGGGQTNLYVYVGNDPINFVDPSGAAAVVAAWVGPALVGIGAAVGVHVGMLAWNSAVLRAVTPPQSAEQVAQIRSQIDELEADVSSAGSAFDRNRVLRNRAVDARDVFYSKNGHWDPAQACVSHYFTGKMSGTGNPFQQYSMPVMNPLYSGAKLGSPYLIWAVSKDGMLAGEWPWDWTMRGAADPSAYQEYWAFQGVRDGRMER